MDHRSLYLPGLASGVAERELRHTGTYSTYPRRAVSIARRA